jgi:hypothetical protein
VCDRGRRRRDPDRRGGAALDVVARFEVAALVRDGGGDLIGVERLQDAVGDVTATAAEADDVNTGKPSRTR